MRFLTFIDYYKSEKIISFFIFIFCISLRLMSTDMIFPSFISLEKYFLLSRATIQFSSFINLLASFITGLVMIFFADNFSRKYLLKISILIFSIGSLIAGISENIYLFYLGRFFQGCGGTTLLIIGYATTQDHYKNKEAAKYYSSSSFIVALIAIISPILGGYIDQNFGWKFNFYTLFLLSVFLFIIVVAWFEDPSFNKINFNINADLGIHEFINDEFFLYYSLISPFLFFSYWIYTTSLPFYLDSYFNISSNKLGYILSLGAVSYLIFSLLSKWLIDHIKLTTCIIIGLVICFFSAIFLFLTQLLKIHSIFIVSTFQFFYLGGCALSFGPSVSKSLSHFEYLKATASALRTSFHNFLIMLGSLLSFFFNKVSLLYASLTTFLVCLLLIVFFFILQNSREG